MYQLITVGALESFLIAIFVLFLGHFINARVSLFKKFNIPEPIVGGLLVSVAIMFMHINGIGG